MVVAIAIVVGAAGFAVLVVMLISLVRQSMRLAGTIADFERAVRPILEQIRTDSERAQSRTERLAERSSRLSPSRPRRG